MRFLLSREWAERRLAIAGYIPQGDTLRQAGDDGEEPWLPGGQKQRGRRWIWWPCTDATDATMTIYRKGDLTPG
jgi:hypothetical protein